MRSRFLFVLLLIAFLFSGRQPVPGADTVPVKEKPSWRVRMLWIPQAEFAGFYLAEAEGLYQAEGVKVVLEHPKTSEDVFETLVKNETDIVVSWPTSALEQVVKGVDVVNVGQMAQRSALMLIVNKKSGITQPGDMKDRRIGLWPSWSLQVPFRKFLSHYGVETFRELPVLTSVDLFLYGGVDATVGVLYDDYYRIYGSGINFDELICFRLSDTFPELVDDGLYCKRTTWEKSPEDCRKIIRATMEGWRRAFQNKNRTLQIIREVQEKNGHPFNIVVQRWMLDVMEDLIFPNGTENDGVFKKASFDEAANLLEIDRKKFTYERFVPGIGK